MVGPGSAAGPFDKLSPLLPPTIDSFECPLSLPSLCPVPLSSFPSPFSLDSLLPSPLALLPTPALPRSSRRKYLVSADGCVAQTRLAKVMLTNSVVLKEESQWIEYYYR